MRIGNKAGARFAQKRANGAGSSGGICCRRHAFATVRIAAALSSKAKFAP